MLTQQIVSIGIIGLKFAVPLFMLAFPFAGSWVNYLLDVIDGDLLQALGMSDFTYQTIDKIADYWAYICMLFLGWRWPIKKLIVGLFAYRTIGQLLFFIWRDEQVFFYFQNVLEPLVMVYTLLLLRNKTPDKTYQVYKKYQLTIWVIILAYKIWNEWYLHLANIDLSLFFFGITG